MQQIFPSHAEQLKRLVRIEGQIRGIHKMVEEQRYCVDIATQIKAAKAALTKVELGVLEKHIHHCVKDAAQSEDPGQLEEKVAEIVKLMGQMA